MLPLLYYIRIKHSVYSPYECGNGWDYSQKRQKFIDFFSKIGMIKTTSM